MIELFGISKSYRRGSEEVHALTDISFSINPGEFVSITGQSGSGKSTLLQIIGCMDCPSSGQLKIEGNEIDAHSDSSLTEIRRRLFGFVFQQFYLIPGLSVSENISLPLCFNRTPVDGAYIHHLLEIVGLQEKSKSLPNQLSGGEMQRVAIARALVNKPLYILADEPTGNLDTENSERIFSLFTRLNRERQTIIMVTHNNELADRSGRIISIRDGRIARDTYK